MFYRGVSAENPTDHPYLKRPRKDREPRASSLHFHTIADKWFLQKFGVAYRSQAIFLTSRPITASAYAASQNHIVRVKPISKYSFCWSPKVSDLLFIAEEYKNSSEEEIFNRLEDSDYQDTDLAGAHSSGHEVMLFCEEYISIPVKLSDIINPKGGIILLP